MENRLYLSVALKDPELIDFVNSLVKDECISVSRYLRSLIVKDKEARENGKKD